MKQVTFEEFLEGANRHPELLEVFLKPEGGDPVDQQHNEKAAEVTSSVLRGASV